MLHTFHPQHIWRTFSSTHHHRQDLTHPCGARAIAIMMPDRDYRAWLLRMCVIHPSQYQKQQLNLTIGLWAKPHKQIFRKRQKLLYAYVVWCYVLIENGRIGNSFHHYSPNLAAAAAALQRPSTLGRKPVTRIRRRCALTATRSQCTRVALCIPRFVCWGWWRRNCRIRPLYGEREMWFYMWLTSTKTALM